MLYCSSSDSPLRDARDFLGQTVKEPEGSADRSLPTIQRILLHATWSMENIRKSRQRIIARLRFEVFVHHSVHDVHLPVPGLSR